MRSRTFVRLLARTHVVPNEKSGSVPSADEAWKLIEAQRKAKNPNHPAKPRPAKFKSDVVLTTVGRCMFNDILPTEMPFYNFAVTSGGGSRVIADTYAALGRPATIKLLDDMKSVGFKRSTL